MFQMPAERPSRRAKDLANEELHNSSVGRSRLDELDVSEIQAIDRTDAN